jgi:tRNA(fMet)-specific endonuclease VapC
VLILDSDVFTLLQEGDPGVVSHLEQARRMKEDVATTIITRAEVLRGRFDYLLKAADREQFLKAQRLLMRSEQQFGALPVLPLAAAALDRFDTLCRGRGARSIGRSDLLIGAIALAHRATVVTRNVKHFSKIPTLHIVDWRD